MKKVRFPKGKKVKLGSESDNANDMSLGSIASIDPQFAARERSRRRKQGIIDHFEDDDENSNPEVSYNDGVDFTTEGILFEPFNLDKEKEEGYFDEEGNFVEYINKEQKDAWLESVEGNTIYDTSNVEDDVRSSPSRLSNDEVQSIKRRIASSLQPGETVLQALRRLKGKSRGKKQKMSTEKQALFDQLTGDADKLLDHGEHNVYHDKQESFACEAEGHGSLDLATENGSDTAYQHRGDAFLDILDPGARASVTTNADTEDQTDAGNEYDIFADDDHGGDVESSSPATNPEAAATSRAGGLLQDDYVYDETSGYYYSNSLGYYYDPSTQLFCCAQSGQWYCFNEETGAYVELEC